MADLAVQQSVTRVSAARRRLPLDWLPVAPFFLYVALFLGLPTLWLMIDAFKSDAGSFTTANVQAVKDHYLGDFRTSLELSLATAVTGSVFGFFVAYAVVKEGAPRWLRPVLITFAGVAANAGGVPLAFSFAATLGQTGVLTAFLREHGLDIYQQGFTLQSFGGLVIVYTYFQMPLMLLVISPALDGLRREWAEAATNLGATSSQYWRWVALPILWPSLLGAFVLLFGSGFAAFATAVALVGTQINLVPIRIGSLLTGDFATSPQLADALALGMILIIGVVMLAYALLQRQSSKWLQR
jgi:putative spermidine/putrescine transport system permease protein